jgi:hypothetical protein
MSSTQALRNRFNQVVSAGSWKEDAINVIDELIARVTTFGEQAETYRAKAKARRCSALPSDADLVNAPTDVLEALDEVVTSVRTLNFDLSELQAYIMTLVPEIKEEDNAGVNIQSYLLEQIGEAQKVLNGAGKESSPRFVHLGGRQEYLSKRSELEMKLAPTGKDAEVPKSQSLRLALHDLDNAVVGNIASTFVELRRISLGVSGTFVRNQDRITQPRRHGHGHGMVG